MGSQIPRINLTAFAQLMKLAEECRRDLIARGEQPMRVTPDMLVPR